MSLEQFQIVVKLGDGSYSSVYKVKRLEDGCEYALKKVKIQNLSDREKENALNEVRILASIKNPFVAGYKQAFFDEPSSSLCIVMEYADDGDVFQRICDCQNQKQYMKEKHIWQITIQVTKGLRALHDLRILHRDMKSANIFLYKDGTAKLGDLNVSKVAKKGLLYTQTGTPYYASPEVWKDQPYDLKSDIWSFGCVVYEMCALVPPFRADDMNGLYKRVLKGQYPPIPSHYSMDMRQLIKTMLQVNPQSRPDTKELLDFPIVMKRYRKYFTRQDGSPCEIMAEEEQTQNLNQNLLQTIKLQKNVFKLDLPQPSYGNPAQYQTMPAETRLQMRNNSHDVSNQQPQTKKEMNRYDSSATIEKQRKQSAAAVKNSKQLIGTNDEGSGGNEDQAPVARKKSVKERKPNHQPLQANSEGVLDINQGGLSSIQTPAADSHQPDVNASLTRNESNANLGQLKSGRGAVQKLKTVEHENSDKPTIQIVQNPKRHRDQVQRSLNPSPSVKTLQNLEPQHRSDKKSRLPNPESKPQLATINKQDEEVNEITSGVQLKKHKQSQEQVLEQQQKIASRITQGQETSKLKKKVNVNVSSVLSTLDQSIDQHDSYKNLLNEQGNNGGLSVSPSVHRLLNDQQQLLTNQKRQAPHLNHPPSYHGSSTDQKEYKRLVNIYQQQEKVISLKSKRKSLQPSNYQRQHHQYGDNGSRASALELPDIYGSGKSSVLRHYNNNQQENQSQISQLLSRKKSYERMLRIEELQSSNPNNQRGDQYVSASGSSNNRPRLSSVLNQPSNAKRQQQLEIQGHASSQKRMALLNEANSIIESPLDITGRNVPNPHPQRSMNARIAQIYQSQPELNKR